MESLASSSRRTLLVDASFVYVIAGVSWLGSWLVKRWLMSTYRKYSKVPNQYRVTGAQTAAAILQAQGITNVKIQKVRGKLTDHFDPVKDVLRLSTSNFDNISVAAMAVSAHEAGHAIQDARRDIRMRLRHLMVPIASIGGRFAPMAVMAGFVTQSSFILRLGALLLAATMVFQLLTLPVEFNASKRARKNLEALGLSDPAQRKGVERVLRAAAFTYVAAAATSVAYFLTLMAASQGRRI